MKKTNRIISIIFIIMTLFTGITVIYAEEINIENIEWLGDLGVIEGENDNKELAPMASRSCRYEYKNLTSMFDDLGLSYEGNSHPYTLSGGYTYSMAPGGSHDYQVVIIWDSKGNQIAMHTCLHA